MNNRKRTRGRLIQAINVPLTVKRTVGEGDEQRIVEIPNPSPLAGHVKQIRHLNLKQ